MIDREPPSDGVIRFMANHTEAPMPPSAGGRMLVRLNDERRILHQLGLIGQGPDGIGFGNFSARMGADEGVHFVITGTQTGEPEELDLERGYAAITGVDIPGNTVDSIGLVKPSSEVMSHAVFYRDSRVGSVAHGHSPDIWNAADFLELPSTPEDVEYGTPDMALALWDIYKREQIYDGAGIIVMKGHKDGVITMGQTPAMARERLSAYLFSARKLSRYMAKPEVDGD